MKLQLDISDITAGTMEKPGYVKVHGKPSCGQPAERDSAENFTERKYHLSRILVNVGRGITVYFPWYDT